MKDVCVELTGNCVTVSSEGLTYLRIIRKADGPMRVESAVLPPNLDDATTLISAYNYALTLAKALKDEAVKSATEDKIFGRSFCGTPFPWTAKCGKQDPKTLLFCTRETHHDGNHVACMVGAVKPKNHPLATWHNNNELDN